MATRVTNFGSCCIDNVYAVPSFVRPGETLPCVSYEIHPGGKGLNQSIAMAYAGANVRHAGRIGTEGEWLKDLLTEAGVDASLLRTVESPSGHAVIQVTPEGENAIVLYGGANRLIDGEDLDLVLRDAHPGEFLLLQNEISHTPEIIKAAAARGMRIVFNAAPMTDAVLDYPLDCIECFIVNELEGAAISGTAISGAAISGTAISGAAISGAAISGAAISGAGTKETTDAEKVISAMAARFPAAKTVLTLGGDGAIYSDPANARIIRQPAFPMQAVDTTGAGDTFTGYFLAGYAGGLEIASCLRRACLAAGLSVTRAGAASSIPRGQDVDQAEQASSNRL